MHKELDVFDLGILSALEARGVIEGYHAQLNAQAMGRSLRAVVRVNLSPHSKENARAFAALVARSPEIREAFAVSGDADYVLLMQCEDLTAFASFVHDTLLPFANVAQVKSEIVLRGLK